MGEKIITCPECGQEVDAKDKNCKNCGFHLKKSKISLISLLVCIIILVGFGLVAFVKISKERKIATIEECKTQMELCNNNADYEEAIKWCEKMIKTDVDNDYSKELKALEFSRDNYDCAKKFYDAIKKLDDSLQNKSYSSLTSLLNSAKPAVNEFDKIEPNMDSEVGKYINTIKTNPIYVNLRDEHINGSKENYDAGLVSDGFAMIIQTDTEILLREKFVGEE